MKIDKKIILIFTILFSIISLSCAKPVKVEGMAMMPELQNGDRILINLSVNDINRGEIISFLYPRDKNKWFIKRVIGLPNETVEIKDGAVFIDGKELKEPYIDQNYNLAQANFAPIKVPGDNYFVLGDNRDNSSDSRVWGTVSKSLIQGKFWYKYAESENK